MWGSTFFSRKPAPPATGKPSLSAFQARSDELRSETVGRRAWNDTSGAIHRPWFWAAELLGVPVSGASAAALAPSELGTALKPWFAAGFSVATALLFVILLYGVNFMLAGFRQRNELRRFVVDLLGWLEPTPVAKAKRTLQLLGQQGRALQDAPDAAAIEQWYSRAGREVARVLGDPQSDVFRRIGGGWPGPTDSSRLPQFCSSKSGWLEGRSHEITEDDLTDDARMKLRQGDAGESPEGQAARQGEG